MKAYTKSPRVRCCSDKCLELSTQHALDAVASCAIALRGGPCPLLKSRERELDGYLRGRVEAAERVGSGAATPSSRGPAPGNFRTVRCCLPRAPDYALSFD